MAVDEVRAPGAYGPSGAIHVFHEGLLGPAVVTGEGGASVVAALHHDSFEKRAPRVSLPRAQAEFGRLDVGVFGHDRERTVKAAAAADEQRGEQFLRAGRRAVNVRIFLENDLAVTGVDHDG